MWRHIHGSYYRVYSSPGKKSVFYCFTYKLKKKWLKIMKLMKIKWWKVNIFKKINSIKWLSSNILKIKKIIFLTLLPKTEIKLKNEIFSILVSVRLTKKNNRFIIFLLSQEISLWVNPRGTLCMYRCNFVYGVFFRQ